ncbi:23294_t:CDS:2, partial [Cetraspora pellucida]
QNNNTSTYNEEVIEVNTCNEEVFETSTHNEDNIQTTTHDKEVSETSTGNKNNMETTTQNEPMNEQGDSTLERNTTSSSKKLANIRPEQEPHAGSSANKKENPYLQDDASITDGVGLQENDLIQDEQKGPLSSSMEIDNDKRNSTPSKDKDLLPDPISAPCDELAALYLNAKLQAGNKNTDKKGKSLQDKNQLRPSPYRKQHNEGLPLQT